MWPFKCQSLFVGLRGANTPPTIDSTTSVLIPHPFVVVRQCPVVRDGKFFYSVHHMFAVQSVAAQHQAPMHAYEWSTSCLHRGHGVVESSLHTSPTPTKSAVQEAAAEAAAALAILRLELLLRRGPLRPVQASLESSFSVFFILLPQAWHRCEQALRHGSASLKESGQCSCATEVVRRRARGETSALRQHPAVRAPQQGAQLAGLSGGRAG